MVTPIILLAALVSSPAAAELTPRHRVVYQALAGVRVNPLGAGAGLELGYRYRLSDSQGLLLKDGWAGVSALLTGTPSYGRAGVRFAAEPLAILRLDATYEYVGYFGTWNELASFPRVSADYSDDVREAHGDAGLSYEATGSLLTLGARLQGKLGNLAVREGARFIRSDLDLREGDGAYYDSTLDVLAPNEGWTFVNDADVLWLGIDRTVVGLRYTAIGAVDGPSGRGQTLHRVGPVVTYELSQEKTRGRFSDPTLILVVNWWLSHPEREGLVPFTQLAFSVSGDLL